MNVTLLGAGAWGTAMAAQAAQHLPPGSVRLWARSPEQAKVMQAEYQNQRYLPDIALPTALQVDSDLNRTLALLRPSDLLVIATPMSGLSETIAYVLQQATCPLNIVWLCKGLEPITALLPHQVVERELVKHGRGITHAVGVVSGPSFANEVARGLPCALTVASKSTALCQAVQAAFHHGNMRI